MGVGERRRAQNSLAELWWGNAVGYGRGRREWVKDLRGQIVTHKRFKRLVDQWIDLSIEHSRLTMRLTMRIAETKAT